MIINLEECISYWMIENQKQLFDKGYAVDDLDYICNSNDINPYSIATESLKQIKYIKHFDNLFLTFNFGFIGVDLTSNFELANKKNKSLNPGTLLCETTESLIAVVKSNSNKNYLDLIAFHNPRREDLEEYKFIELKVTDEKFFMNIDTNKWSVYLQYIKYIEKDDDGKNFEESNILIISKLKIDFVKSSINSAS